MLHVTTKKGIIIIDYFCYHSTSEPQTWTLMCQGCTGIEQKDGPCPQVVPLICELREHCLTLAHQNHSQESLSCHCLTVQPCISICLSSVGRLHSLNALEWPEVKYLKPVKECHDVLLYATANTDVLFTVQGVQSVFTVMTTKVIIVCIILHLLATDFEAPFHALRVKLIPKHQ